MKNDVEIDFQLWATSIPPKEISKRTGITPDVELLRGERNNKLNLPRENLWALRSNVKSDLVADHWSQLEQVLGGHKDVLRELSQTGIAKITIIVNGAARMPSIIIPPAMSSFAAFLNAVIDIDHLQQ
jgi:hypothetical protein